MQMPWHVSCQKCQPSTEVHAWVLYMEPGDEICIGFCSRYKQRYERQDPLSPLRSPLNAKGDINKQWRYSERRRKSSPTKKATESMWVWLFSWSFKYPQLSSSSFQICLQQLTLLTIVLIMLLFCDFIVIFIHSRVHACKDSADLSQMSWADMMDQADEEQKRLDWTITVSCCWNDWIILVFLFQIYTDSSKRRLEMDSKEAALSRDRRNRPSNTRR